MTSAPRVDRRTEPSMALTPGEMESPGSLARQRSRAIQAVARERSRQAALFLARARSFARHARLQVGERRCETLARREASDPTTTGTRLREIVMSGTHSHASVRQGLQNPGLPLDVLREALQDVVATTGLLIAAWYNPSVLLLLLHEPSSEYPEAARDALVQRTLESERHLMADRPLRLDAYTSAWASLPREPAIPWDQRRKDAYRQCRAFAHHLAGLFGLPWPGT